MEASPWLWLSLAVALLSLLRKYSRSGGGRLPPGPTPLPLVGSLLELGRHPHRSLARLAKAHGPVMALQLGSVTTIVVSSPAAAREVLQKKDQSLSARYVPDAIRVLGHDEASLIWIDPSGKHWKSLRNIWRAHLFTSQRLDAGRGLRHQKVRELIAHIRERAGRSTVDVGRAAFGTMLNVLSNTVFSIDMVDVNSDSAQEFKSLVWAIMEEVGAPNLADFFPVLRFIDPQGQRRRVAKHFEKLFAIFDRMIDGRLQALAEGKPANPPATKDLLDELLHLHLQENGTKLERPAIKSLIADMFIAGTDTSSTTVEWAMAELLRSPGAMAKARSEIAAVVGPEREVEESDISALPFLQAVVKETLRLHPPAPLLLPHRAETSAELCGYTVPAGSRVLMNVWAIGRDEEAWVDPESFAPERFLGSEVDFRGGHFELIPFSSGRRICPGMPLAFRSMHLMIASLLHSFEWRLPEGKGPSDVDVTEKFGVTLAMAVSLQAMATPARHGIL